MTPTPRLGTDRHRPITSRGRPLALVAAVAALALGPLAILPAAAAPTSPRLWNHLGSDAEVASSEIGPGFAIRNPAQVRYVAGVEGNAIATTGDTTRLEMSPSDFFGPDRTEGTVEVWLQKRIPKAVPFQTPLVGIFGQHLYGGQLGLSSYPAISAFWSDDFFRDGGLAFEVIDSTDGYHLASDLAFDDVPVGQWVHLAFAWDLAGIDGTADRLRIYRDGVLTAWNRDEIADLYPSEAPVTVLGHHAYYRLGEPMAYLDELKVYPTAFNPMTGPEAVRSCYSSSSSVPDEVADALGVASISEAQKVATAIFGYLVIALGLDPNPLPPGQGATSNCHTSDWTPAEQPLLEALATYWDQTPEQTQRSAIALSAHLLDIG